MCIRTDKEREEAMNMQYLMPVYHQKQQAYGPYGYAAYPGPYYGSQYGPYYSKPIWALRLCSLPRPLLRLPVRTLLASLYGPYGYAAFPGPCFGSQYGPF